MTRAVIENELFIDIPKLTSGASRIHGREARTRAVKHMRIITAGIRREWQPHGKRATRIHPEEEISWQVNFRTESLNKIDVKNNHQVNFQNQVILRIAKVRTENQQNKESRCWK